MKKILSLALAFVMLLSVFMLSGCDKDDDNTAPEPGTYDLTYNSTDKDAKQVYRKLIGFNYLGYGEDTEYSAKVGNYGYKKVGFSVDIRNPWIYPCRYENVKIKLAVSYTYNTYTSSNKTVTEQSEMIEIEIAVDENGNARYEYVAPANVEDNVYCQLAFNPRIDQYKVLEVSGTAVVLPRQDPTEKPTSTPDSSAQK